MKTRKDLHTEAKKFGGSLITPMNQKLIARYFGIKDFKGYCCGTALFWLIVHIENLRKILFKHINTPETFISFEESIKYQLIQQFQKSVYALQNRFAYSRGKGKDISLSDDLLMDQHVSTNSTNILFSQCKDNIALRREFIDDFCYFILRSLDDSNDSAPQFFYLTYDNALLNSDSDMESQDIEWLGHCLGLIVNFPAKDNITFFDSEQGIFGFPNLISFCAWLYNIYLPDYVLLDFDMKYAKEISFNLVPLAYDLSLSHLFVSDPFYQSSQSKNLDFSKISLPYVCLINENQDNLKSMLGKIYYDLVPGRAMDQAIFIADELFSRNNISTSNTSYSLFSSFKDKIQPNQLILFCNLQQLPLHELLEILNEAQELPEFISKYTQYLVNKICNNMSENERTTYYRIPGMSIEELRNLIKIKPNTEYPKSKHIELYAIKNLMDKLEEKKIAFKKSRNS